MNIKRWRLLAAITILCVAAAAFFVDDPSLRARVLSWQLTPALLALAGSALFIIVVAASTALFGRVYCSVLCPAGIVQEFAFRIGRKLGFAKTGFAASPRLPWALLAATVFLAAGIPTVANYLDPVGWFGRFVAPPAELAAGWREGNERYAAYLGTAGIAFAVAVLLLIGVAAFKGRWFCDRLCPVGSALGPLADLSLRRIDLDAASCVACGRCAAACPTRCIDAKEKRLDHSRCVLCLSCLADCPKHAITYHTPNKPERRRVLARGAALVGSAAYFAARGWRGSAVGAEAVLPPGAGNASSYYRACIGCQSCAAACPVGIIKPRFPGMQPELRFDLGACLYNCERCTAACPAGALHPLTPEEKKTTRIATTEFLLQRCVVMTEGTACGACAEVCPTRALSMEHWEEGKPTRPVFYPEHCIGCGACRYACPARPLAFEISGLAKHETALPMRQTHPVGNSEAAGGDGMTDFPF